MRTYKNLTPQCINLVDKETGKIIISFKSEGDIKVTMNSNYTLVDGVPCGIVEYTELKVLPEPVDNTVYILSLLAFEAARKQGRTDICYPAGKIFWNNQGQIIGVEFLAFVESRFCFTSKKEIKTTDSFILNVEYINYELKLLNKNIAFQSLGNGKFCTIREKNNKEPSLIFDVNDISTFMYESGIEQDLELILSKIEPNGECIFFNEILVKKFQDALSSVSESKI